MNFIITASNVLIMLLYMVPGFFLIKFKKVELSHSKSLSAILVYICAPMLILSSFLELEFSKNNLIEMLLFFVATLIIQIIFITLIYLVFKKKFDNSKYRLMTLAAICGNVGFFGLPLISALFPDQPIVKCYSSMYVLSMNLIAFTLGVYFLTRNKKYISIKSALTNPTSIAIFISFPLFLLNVKLPDNLFNAVSLLGKMSTPLCMFILGMRLGSCNFKHMIQNKYAYGAAILKLVIFPLFSYLCVYFIPGLSDTFKVSILVLSAVPSAALILSLGELYDSEQELSANIILITSLLCCVTLPLLLLIV